MSNQDPNEPRDDEADQDSDESREQDSKQKPDEPRDDGSGQYNASSIQVLEGLEAVRKRPAMYIGDTQSMGLHHLIWEVVDNSVDEALQKRCDRIVVKIHNDGSVSVLDNGAGIPTDTHPKLGVPALEVILTKLHAGGKFDKGSYQVSGGLHGVGVSVVNALSEWLEVEVYRNGKIHRQTFERGNKTSELKILGDTDKRGTLIHYHADSEVFESTEIVWQIVHRRMRELAYLMGSFALKIIVEDERTGARDELKFPKGIVDFVNDLNRGKNVLHDEVIFVNKIHYDAERDADYGVEVALQYNDGYNENIHCFVNNISTTEGGTHLVGFKSALTRSLNHFAKKNNLVKDKEKPPAGDDLREGLTAVVSVKVPDPQFESQTKIRLGNREVESIVTNVVGEGLRSYFEENPRVGKSIFEKAMEAARAREAARKAREQVRRKSAMESSSLPLKLADCHKGTARTNAELFLVEGDSAGGSAITGRASFQAILPLRGKILNVEKAPIHKVMDHREIEAIVSAVGTGFVGEEFDEEKIRYSKVIIMTDADVDGSHIRTLLLTFFYRKMPELIRRGHIFVAQPPLYLVEKGKKQIYVHNERDLAMTQFDLGLDAVQLTIEGKELTGAKLRDAVETLRGIRDEAENISSSPGSVSISELVKLHDEFKRWPTHRLVLRSDGSPLEVPGTAGIKRSDGSTELFVLGGEAELEEIIAAATKERPDLKISSHGTDGEDGDLMIESLHLSKKLKQRLEHAQELGLPLDLFDRGQESPDDALAEEDGRIEVKVGKETSTVASLIEALELVLTAPRSDIQIKRFKGLGEMEAAQLWESTMDPATRILYKVELADAQEADELFTILMGSVVEPRREFIEKHALEVSNLDV